MATFDAIIIGAGPAGSTAGLLLARAGLNVLIIERGQSSGSKNVSGGLIYSRTTTDLLPDLWENAPVERAITAHQLVMLSEKGSLALDFRSQESAQPPYNAFSVLRARFDPWLAKQAEDAGATLITGVAVDSLLVENGRVIGIRAGSDQIDAEVVVVAEGASSLLLEQADLREAFLPHDVSIGVKEVIELPEEIIEERFLCTPETGTAYTLVGHTRGIEGGGFLYTNKDTLSLGIVVKIDALYASKLQPHEVLDGFKSHPLITRLIEGGDVVEYSAQTVHRGGFHLMSRLYGDGYVVAGSAARLLLNNIMTMRGMDFAMISAAAAAEAIVTASNNGTYSATELADYETNLKQTSIYRDWQTFSATYPFLENKRLFDLYPELAYEVLEKLFVPTGQPGSKAFATLRKEMRGKVSMLDLAKDLYQIARGIVL